MLRPSSCAVRNTRCEDFDLGNDVRAADQTKHEFERDTHTTMYCGAVVLRSTFFQTSP